MRGSVLIIESNVELGETLRDLVASAGHEAVHTEGGQAGLLLVARARWDVVLLSLRTRDLAGEAVARVLGDLGTPAVVVLSASASGTWRAEAFAAGATACLSKPFRPESLLALLEALFSGTLRGPAPPGDVRTLGAADLERVRAMSDDELDALPFGLLRVDAQGTITAYNAFEARTAGYARSDVVGRRFSDVAPCVMVKEFAGAIERGFAERRLDRVLRFIFPVHEAECIVNVRLFYDERRDQTWIFVTRRRD